MKSLKKIAELASKFENKLSKVGQAPPPDTNQAKEAPDFFFGTGYALTNFQGSLGKIEQDGNKVFGDKSVAKILADFFNKTSTNASVTLGVEVVPGKGAQWVLNITPAAIKGAIAKELDAQFTRLVGKSMVDAAKEADAAAKKGAKVEGVTKKTIVDKGV